jgi:hypothetical protein
MNSVQGAQIVIALSGLVSIVGLFLLFSIGVALTVAGFLGVLYGIFVHGVD